MNRLNINLATALTISRALLIPPMLLLLISRTHAAVVVAAILFGVAVATDFLDGFIARTYDQVSPLGGFLDPLCDKLLVYTLALFFVAEGKMSLAFALPIFIRDLVVEAVRNWSAWKGSVLPANRWGKMKFNLQVVALTFSFSAVLHSAKAEFFIGAADLTLGLALAFSLPGMFLLAREPHNPAPAADG